MCEEGGGRREGGRMVSFSPLFRNSTHKSTFQPVPKNGYTYIDL